MKFTGLAFDTIRFEQKEHDEKIYSFGIIKGHHEQYQSGEDYVVFSGEIYSWPKNMNYASSPAENLLRIYKNHGIEAIPWLNGKFSAIIKVSERLFILRDLLGTQTPVYYNYELFTNSLKMLKKHQVMDFKADKDALITFLHRGFIPAPQSPVSGLKKLAPGEYLSYYLRNKQFTVNKVMDYESYIAKTETFNGSFEDAIKIYKDYHQKAIKSRIKEKSRVALLLSGGYDSGGNLAALREVYHGKIDAYSIGFKNSEWSETPLARIMAERFNANHHIIIMEGDEIEKMPELVDIFEEPFFENGLMVNYKISQSLKSSTADVILGGDGNDQFFGTRSREMAIKYYMQKSGLQLFQKAFRKTLMNSPKLFRYGYHNNAILNALETDEFGFTREQIKKLFSNTPIPHQKKIRSSWFDSYNQLYFNRNYNTDILKSAAQIIVHKANMTTHASKLNVVFPYSDPTVFDFVNSLPRKFKVNGTTLDILRNKTQSKHLFKEYLKPVLPDEIVNKKKQGGFAPLEIFLDNPQYRKRIYQFVVKILENVDFIDSIELKNMFRDIESDLYKKDQWFWFIQTRHSQIMYLFVLAIWWQQFINNNKASF
ncbi:MAG: hypothetical protein K9H84_07845 [Bacteroidales bacterium]|nr:hypothetical protein [Bacteroidales bacterium]